MGEYGRNLEMSGWSGPSSWKDTSPGEGVRAERSSVRVPCGGKAGAEG